MNMAGTQRIREKIVSYMREKGEGTTADILEYVNENSRHGTTMNQLGNILAKSKVFVKVDYIDETVFEHRNRVCTWKLRDED